MLSVTRKFRQNCEHLSTTPRNGGKKRGKPLQPDFFLKMAMFCCVILGKFTLIRQRNHVRKVVAVVDDLIKKGLRTIQFGRQRFSI